MRELHIRRIRSIIQDRNTATERSEDEVDDENIITHRSTTNTIVTPPGINVEEETLSPPKK